MILNLDGTSENDFAIGNLNDTYKLILAKNTSMDGNLTFTFPANDGDANQVLSTDGDGNLSWVDMSGGGGSSSAILTKSSNYTLTNTDIANYKYFHITTGSSANVTITLPQGSSAIENMEIVISKIDSGTKFVKIDRSGSDTIRGSASSIYAIQQFEEIRLIWNGSEYVLLGEPYRTVSALISNSGTPSISRQSCSWISSLTDIGTGNTTVNINTGVFLSAPYAFINATSTSGSINAELGDSGSTSSILARTKNVITNADADNDFMLSLHGPK